MDSESFQTISEGLTDLVAAFPDEVPDLVERFTAGRLGRPTFRAGSLPERVRTVGRDHLMSDPSFHLDPSAAAFFVSIVWMLCAWWAGKTRDMP
jgi:hypothetical protein